MNLSRLALTSALLLSVGVFAAGCKNDDDSSTTDTANLGTNESQLIEDDSEAADADDDVESGVDDPLSGATTDDPGNPADADTDDGLLEKIRDRAQKFFNIGCLESTRDGNTLHHVFHHCTGPYGMKDFDGTITSTYVREPGKLTVTHAADGFFANGATLAGSRVIVYTRGNGIITKHRTGNWTGTTEKGKPLAHTADFTTVYDSSTKCITRDGSAESSVGERSQSRTIEGYKRCGIGRGGCPDSGKFTLSRTNKADDTTTLSIEFLGGRRYQVTRPSGKVVERALVCNPRAS